MAVGYIVILIVGSGNLFIIHFDTLNNMRGMFTHKARSLLMYGG